MMFTLL